MKKKAGGSTPILLKLGTNVEFGEFRIMTKKLSLKYFIPFKVGGPS